MSETRSPPYDGKRLVNPSEGAGGGASERLSEGAAKADGPWNRREVKVGDGGLERVYEMMAEGSVSLWMSNRVKKNKKTE